MSNTEQEHQQDIQRRREESARRRQEAERVVAEILVSISESGKEARQWFADLEEGARGRVIEALTASDPALSQSSDEAIGYVEGLKDKLPQENGQQVKVSLMNEDGNTVEVDIVRQDGKYYRIVEGEDEEVTIDGDTLVKRSKFNFEEELAKRFEQYKNENNIEGAISRKDFGLINRIIKNGANITATQLIAMMRLSTSELHGSRRTTPTFLHKLLDTKTGIADSDRVKPLLMTAKHILGTFEFNALCGLSDGTKPASTLFVRTLRDMLPAASVLKNADINTHETSVHASVDISLVKLYQKWKEAHSDVVPESTSIERGSIEIIRTDEFKGFVNLLASQLKDEINVYLNDKSKIEAISGIDSKNGDAEKEKKIKRKTLELAAAKRLMEDVCSAEGIMKCGFEVKFNEIATNGVTLKEALAIVYSSIKSAENLESGATELDGFAKLVTHLFEARREYNVDKYGVDTDKNKCPGGCMNHFVDALSGICKGIHAVYVTNDDIKKEVSEIINKQLIGYLEKKRGDDKEGFRIALAKYAFGTDLSKAIDSVIIAMLKQDVKAEIKLMHEEHFKDDRYIDVAEGAVSTVKADKGMLQELGEIKYSEIWQPAELLEAMKSGTLPLYTRTDQGYRLTSDIIKEKETDYYVQVENLIFESKNFDLLIKYQMNTEGMLGRVLAKLEAEEPAVGKLVDSLEKIRSYFPDAVSDKGFIRLLIKAAPDPFRRRTVLHWAVCYRNTEIVKALIEKMDSKDLAIQNREGSTALRRALMIGHTEIAKALIDKMDSKDLARKDQHGCTALHLAVMLGRGEIVRELLRAGADAMIRNPDGKTAFDVANGEAKIILETDRFLKDNIAVEPHKVMQKIIERSMPILFADKLRGDGLNPLDQKMIKDYLNTKIETGVEESKQVTRLDQILENGTTAQQEMAMKYGADPSLVSDIAKNHKNSSMKR